MRPLLVGEANPYGGDPAYALYPSPDGLAGHRLCTLVLGMRRLHFIQSFDRCNLCPQQWSKRVAEAGTKQMHGRSKVVLLGAKVCSAVRVDYEPLRVHRWATSEWLVLPHPSGLCRYWSDPASFARARQAVAAFLPELADLFGVVDGGDESLEPINREM